MPAPLLAIDAPSLLYRAFHALPKSITGPDGTPVNALLDTANLVLRICKGAHGCNKNDADWVSDNDDYSGTDVWPQTSFTCGQGFPEVASADYSKYKFVYNWLVRAKDGNNAVSNGIATLCAKAPESACRSATANPTMATTNTVPATEAEVYMQREGMYFGDMFPRNYWVADLKRWKGL